MLWELLPCCPAVLRVGELLPCCQAVLWVELLPCCPAALWVGLLGCRCQAEWELLPCPAVLWVGCWCRAEWVHQALEVVELVGQLGQHASWRSNQMLARPRLKLRRYERVRHQGKEADSELRVSAAAEEDEAAGEEHL